MLLYTCSFTVMLRFLTAKGFRRALAVEDTGHAASKRIPITSHTSGPVSQQEDPYHISHFRTCNHIYVLSRQQYAPACTWLFANHTCQSDMI